MPSRAPTESDAKRMEALAKDHRIRKIPIERVQMGGPGSFGYRAKSSGKWWYYCQPSVTGVHVNWRDEGGVPAELDERMQLTRELVDWEGRQAVAGIVKAFEDEKNLNKTLGGKSVF